MNRRPERLGDLLPAVIADLAARHGVAVCHPNPRSTTMTNHDITAPPPDEQTLEEFVEWFRTDLVYKAPETWPSHISWFLNTLVARYGSAA